MSFQGESEIGDSLENTDAVGEESNDSDQKHMGFMLESVDEDLIL